jgi:endonuclease YncB( thermonuclease family)
VGTHREYTSVVFAGAEPLGTGHGATKQEAEQEAARAALESLIGAVKPSVTVKPPRASRTRARRGAKARPSGGRKEDVSLEVAEGAEAIEAAEEATLSVVPLPAPPAEPETEHNAGPDPEPQLPRSRQLGAPID